MRCSSCGEGTVKVLETRVAEGYAFVMRRRTKCPLCGAKKTTFEIPAEVFKHAWYRYRVKEHETGALKRIARAKRNAEILERVRKGEKHLVIALDMGLSNNMVTTIANRAGLYRRPRKENGNT